MFYPWSDIDSFVYCKSMTEKKWSTNGFIVLMIKHNFVWQNVRDGKCSSEGKGPQKTGGQGQSEGIRC